MEYRITHIAPLLVNDFPEDFILNQEKGVGVAKRAGLRVKNGPVFYLPYMSFPLDDTRKTGFLFPLIGSGDDGGLDLSAPFYINIAPHWDATLTPRFISKRGSMIEAEVRHLNKYSSWVVSHAEIDDDITNDRRSLDAVYEQGNFGAGWWHDATRRDERAHRRLVAQEFER